MPQQTRSVTGPESPNPGAAAASPPRRGPGRPLTYQPDEERAMMIRAAYRALARQPSGAVSVSEILTEAGLSTRSFYRHFKSKDELLLAIFAEESEQAKDDLLARLDRAPDPRAALEEWIRFYLSLAFEAPRHKRVLVMQSPELTRIASYPAAVADVQNRNRQPLVALLEAGAAGGYFRHTSPAEDAVMIQDIVTGIVMRRRDGLEQTDAESALTMILDFLARAIGLRI